MSEADKRRNGSEITHWRAYGPACDDGTWGPRVGPDLPAPVDAEEGQAHLDAHARQKGVYRLVPFDGATQAGSPRLLAYHGAPQPSRGGERETPATAPASAPSAPGFDSFEGLERVYRARAESEQQTARTLAGMLDRMQADSREWRAELARHADRAREEAARAAALAARLEIAEQRAAELAAAESTAPASDPETARLWLKLAGKVVEGIGTGGTAAAGASSAGAALPAEEWTE